MKKALPSLLLAICLSGCSLIPNPGEPPKRFTLDSAKAQGASHGSKQKIMVDIPNVYPPIDNQRIGVVPELNRIDYYADCEWGDRLGVLVQDSLIYSLQNRLLFSGVTRTHDGATPDLLLKVDVRKFFVIQKPQPTAVVQYYAQLTRLTDRQVISQQEFETMVPLKNEHLDEIGMKLNQAHIATVNKMLDWLTQNNH